MAAKKGPAKHIGRPSIFTQEICDLICERLALGESLRSICSDKTTPAMSSVFKWLRENEPFSQQYTRARETQADALADEILNIADDARNDWMERHGKDDEGWIQNGEALRRSQIRIDARKWLAGKMRPKKYGDKISTEISGEIKINPFESLLEALDGRAKSIPPG
jgi:hypothetical protein